MPVPQRSLPARGSSAFGKPGRPCLTYRYRTSRSRTASKTSDLRSDAPSRQRSRRDARERQRSRRERPRQQRSHHNAPRRQQRRHDAPSRQRSRTAAEAEVTGFSPSGLADEGGPHAPASALSRLGPARAHRDLALPVLRRSEDQRRDYAANSSTRAVPPSASRPPIARAPSSFRPHRRSFPCSCWSWPWKAGIPPGDGAILAVGRESGGRRTRRALPTVRRGRRTGR
jgi:hypothetical protein